MHKCTNAQMPKVKCCQMPNAKCQMPNANSKMLTLSQATNRTISLLWASISCTSCFDASEIRTKSSMNPFNVTLFVVPSLLSVLSLSFSCCSFGSACGTGSPGLSICSICRISSRMRPRSVVKLSLEGSSTQFFHRCGRGRGRGRGRGCERRTYVRNAKFGVVGMEYGCCGVRL